MDSEAIATERLELRALSSRDADGLHAVWSDAETLRYWHLPVPASVEESRQRIEAMRADATAAYWTIRLRGAERPIGHVGFPSTAAGRRCPFGYLIGREWWGRGYAPEAGRSALEAGFGLVGPGLGLAGAELWIYDENARSVRVAEKLGCTLRGRFVAFNLARRELIPTLVYGVTASELGPHGAAPDPVAVYSVHPVLAVSDVARALEFYCGRLGFQLDWSVGDPPVSAAVSRTDWTPLGATLRLTQEVDSAARPSGWLAIAVDDVDRLHRELGDAGVEVEAGPVDRPWGLREFELVDPFGHRLQFTTPAR